MLNLTRPEGSQPEDFHLSRRLVGGLFFGGYAVSALAAKAEPIHTDDIGLITETVMLPAADRPIPAYVARPDVRGRLPVVVVISEIYGVHEYIRDVCRRLAKAGYVALAPDFYVRYGDPAPLTDPNAIRALVSKVTYQQAMGDVEAALVWLRGQRFVERRRMGITGFCWGGAVVWQACSNFPDFRAGVAWYGRLARPKPGEFLSEPERQWPLDLVYQLKAPVLGLYGEKDSGIPVSDVDTMRVRLRATGKVGSDIVVYPGVGHAFHADYRGSYSPAAAEDGWRRMLDFFHANGVRRR